MIKLPIALSVQMYFSSSDDCYTFRALLATKLENGNTGKVAFDSDGDRLNPDYYIQNVKIENGQKKLEDIGYYVDPKVCCSPVKVGTGFVFLLFGIGYCRFLIKRIECSALGIVDS